MKTNSSPVQNIRRIAFGIALAMAIGAGVFLSVPRQSSSRLDLSIAAPQSLLADGQETHGSNPPPPPGGKKS